MRVRQVFDHEVEGMMSFIAPYLKSAADSSRGQCIPEDFIVGVLDHTLDAFLVYNDTDLVGAFTLALLTFPDKNVCEIVTMAVDAPDENWKGPVDAAITEWARQHGCIEIEGSGRPGWARALKALGYTPTFVTVGKRLDA